MRVGLLLLLLVLLLLIQVLSCCVFWGEVGWLVGYYDYYTDESVTLLSGGYKSIGKTREKVLHLFFFPFCMRVGFYERSQVVSGTKADTLPFFIFETSDPQCAFRFIFLYIGAIGVSSLIASRW